MSLTRKHRQVQAFMFCPKCGKKISEAVKFCSNCGYNLQIRNKAINEEESTPIEENSAIAALKAPDLSYKVCAALTGICALVLLFNWISFPAFGTLSGFAQGVTNTNIGISSEHTIPGLTLLMFELNSYINSIGNSISDLSEMLESISLLMMFLCVAWLCALGFCIASLVNCLRKKTIFNVHLNAAFGWTLAVSSIVVASTLLLNISLTSVVDGYSGSASSALGIVYISSTVWAWVALIISAFGLWLVLSAQKQQSLDKTYSNERKTQSFKNHVCPVCGETVIEGDSFCLRCGSDLEDVEFGKQHFCWNCKALLNENDLYCSNCGASQKDQKSEILTSNQEEIEPAVNAKVCPKCGAELEDSWKFCGKCGAPRA